MGYHTTRYPAEVRERAIRLILDRQADHASQWEATASIAAKVGCTAETLRRRVRQTERDRGARPGVSTEDSEWIRTLQREVHELRQANARRFSAVFFWSVHRDGRPCVTGVAPKDW